MKNRIPYWNQKGILSKEWVADLHHVMGGNQGKVSFRTRYCGPSVGNHEKGDLRQY